MWDTSCRFCKADKFSACRSKLNFNWVLLLQMMSLESSIRHKIFKVSNLILNFIFLRKEFYYIYQYIFIYIYIYIWSLLLAAGRKR